MHILALPTFNISLESDISRQEIQNIDSHKQRQGDGKILEHRGAYACIENEDVADKYCHDAADQRRKERRA